MIEKKTLEERITAIEEQINAVGVAWKVFKWLGRIILAIAGLFAAYHVGNNAIR